LSDKNNFGFFKIVSELRKKCLINKNRDLRFYDCL
jgi:hypothetical protein